MHKHIIILLSCAILLTIAILGRWHFIDFISGDTAAYVSPWIEHIRKLGILKAYGVNFSNYTPLYTYLLGIVNLFFPYMTPAYLAKGLTFMGDLWLAVYIAYLVKIYGNSRSLSPLIAFCVVCAAPSLLINGAAAGQCDVFYCIFLLITSHALFKQQYFKALTWYGLAISFKLQAIFLAPFLLTFFLQKRITWLKSIIPIFVYLILIVPCLIQGRTLTDLLLIYWSQFNTYGVFGFSPNLPNVLMPLLKNHENFSLYFFIILTSIIGLLTTIFAKHIVKRADFFVFLLIASCIVGLMPYFLPKMLDRYFIPLDVFTLVLGCLRPRWLILTLMTQVSTLLAYPSIQFATIVDWTGWSDYTRHAIGAVLNGIVLSFLCFKVYAFHLSEKLKQKTSFQSME